MEGDTRPDTTQLAGSSQPLSATALFVAFLGVGLSGFGGVLPFVRRMLVEDRRWMTPAEFTDTLGLAQLLPGPNVVNVAIFFGARHAGFKGAAACFAGLMALPIVIVIGLSVVYSRYGDVPVIADALRGVASAAAGLIVAMAVKIAWPVLRSPRTILLAAAIFVAMAVLRVPLVWMLAISVPVAIAWTRATPK